MSRESEIVPKGLGDEPGASAPESLAHTAELDVEVWDDPEWGPALGALEGYDPGPKFTGRSNPVPLAKLLISGKPVPEAVAKELGFWLNPPWGKKGPHIVAILPKRYYPGTDRIKSLITLKRKVETALEKTGKLESAVAEVMQETGLSRSYVMEAHQLTKEEIIIRTSKFNPDPFLSPREEQSS